MTASYGFPDELIVEWSDLAKEETFERFRQAGCLQVSNFLPRPTVEAMGRAIAPVYDAMMAHDQFVVVGNRRHRFSVPIKGVFLDPDLFAPAPLAAFLERALGPSHVLDSFSCVTALPGAPAQHVHRDWRLYGDRIDFFVPPFALHLHVPLVPLNAANGSTCFWPGSHRNPDPSDDADCVYPQLELGSAVLADYRIVHQGTPNQSAAPRPLLSLGYTRSWFVDSRNYYPRLEAVVVDAALIDAMDEYQRILFSRGRTDRNLRAERIAAYTP